jgi:hypothetical protein
MPDREFKIKITTSANTAGIKEGETALGGLSGKTSQYIDKLKETRRESENLELSHHQMHRVVRMLGGSFGELGKILGEAALVSPAMAAFGALFMLLNKVKEAHDGMAAALKARIDIGNVSKMVADINQLSASMTQAVESAGIFYDKIHRLAHAQEDLGKQTDAAIAAIERQAEAEKKGMDARQKLDLAKIDALAKAGIITAEQAAARKAKIEDDYAKKSADAADQKDRDVFKARLKERADIASGKDGRDVARTSASIEATNAANELGDAKARVEHWKKTIERLDKYMEEHGASLGPRAQIDELKKQRKAQEELSKAESELAAPTQRDAAARAKLEEADRAVEEAAKRKKELDAQIPQMMSTMEAAAKARRADLSYAQQTRAAMEQGAEAGSPIGKLISQAAGAEHTLQAGGRVSAAQQSQINVLKQMLDRHGENSEQILGMLGKLVGKNEQFIRQIAVLSQRLDQTKLQQRNTFNQ